MNALRRYAFAAVGPIGSAGAQFLLTFLLLRMLPPAGFGVFSFLLVTSILATGIWNALFCAPVLVLSSQGESPRGMAQLHGVMAANLIATAVACCAFIAVAMMLGLGVGAALLFAAFAGLGLVRWLGRTYAYSRGEPWRTISSDLIYALVLLLGVAFLFFSQAATLEAAFTALLVATIASLAPLGLPYLRMMASRLGWRSLSEYRGIWHEHARWALAGVLSTEATANCHAYLVITVYGPVAFAPIVATQMLVRPVAVASNALVEYERARMARAISAGDTAMLRPAITHFRTALLGLTVVNGLAALALLMVAPRLMFSDQYSIETLTICTVSWLAVMLVKALRTAESALLQAAGAYRPLAMASLYSAFFSILSVVILLALDLPIWTVAGVVTGELVFMYWLLRQADKWLGTNAPASVVDGCSMSDNR